MMLLARWSSALSLLLCLLHLRAAAAVAAVAAAAVAAGDAACGKPCLRDFGPCYRECIAGEPPMVCRYTFTEEMYNAMNSACGNCSRGVQRDCCQPGCVAVDGVERTVFVYNRELPGPSIHACVGDVIEVELRVHLPGHGDSVHWHGLEQRHTPHMDGVSMVTQCPVLEGQAFRYRFTLDKAGTYFYHAHNGINKVNGAVGALVARAPLDEDPAAGLYDRDLAEHTVFLMDWLHVDAEYVFPGLRSVGQQAVSLLINGKGNFQDPVSGNWTQTPLAELRVKRGLRYRLRIINSGGLSCPIVLQVQGHRMTVIASDSRDVKPVQVDTLYSFSGERYDVVLEADQDGDAFWMHSRTAGPCSRAPVDQVAVLRYVEEEEDCTATDQDGGLPSTPRPTPRDLQPEGVVLNTPACVSNASSSSLCVTDLRAVSAPEPPGMLDAEPDSRVVLGVGFHTYTNAELFQSRTYPKFISVGTGALAGMVGNVTFQTPPSPLLTQPGDCPQCRGCPDGQDFCICTHVIPVELGDRYDIVLVDVSDVRGDPALMLAHPMHLHGYSFLVMALGSLANITSGRERLQYVTRNAGLLLGNNPAPPAKDTLILPGAGYAVVRIKADNPGMWFFHCHFQYHMASGMEAVFQVGEVHDFVKTPKHFPVCGNYLSANP